MDKYRTLVNNTQRLTTIKICRAYSTISAETASVIAGVVPIHLLVTERKALYELGRKVTEKRQEKSKGSDD